MKKLVKAWNWLEQFLVGVLAFSAIIVTLYSVFMRYVLNNAPEWVEEIVTYMIIMAVYIIASTLAEERGHVGATFIVDRFPKKYRRIIEIINGALSLIFFLVVMYLGVKIIRVTLMTGESSMSSMRFPMWITYLSVPLGASLLSLRSIKRLYRLLFRFTPEDLKESHELSRSKE